MNYLPDHRHVAAAQRFLFITRKTVESWPTVRQDYFGTNATEQKANSQTIIITATTHKPSYEMRPGIRTYDRHTCVGFAKRKKSGYGKRKAACAVRLGMSVSL